MKHRSKKLLRYILGSIIIVLLVSWVIYVIDFNRKVKELDEVPIENHELGEYVSLGHNYSYGDFLDGYSVRVNNYEILDIDTYLERYNKTEDEFNFSTERVCIVDMTIKYEKPEGNVENQGICLDEYWLFGIDFFEGQNSEFFALENPQMGENRGLILSDGQEYDVTLVYNMVKRYYSTYSWNHMDQLEMGISFTAFPVRKNIMLQ